MSETFKALVVAEQEGKFVRHIQNRQIRDLPEGDLVVKVQYSSLNYKDALSASGNKGVTRNYPHTPGIDAVGTVFSSENPAFQEGESVIVTSYDLGMNTAGGFGQYIRVPSEWALKLPEGLSAKEAMMLGTAGLTAGMSVLRFTELVKPEAGKVLVSGATGGVGSLSVAILAKLGYEVIAITGKESAKDYLLKLGAKDIVLRQDFEALADKPLLKSEYAGGIDTVGGTILQNMLKTTSNMGVVTACGNAASIKLNLTVFPFILRGVSLIGIDSQNYEMTHRKKVWNKLANEWKIDQLADNTEEVSLENLSEKIDLMLAGKIRGRYVVNLQAVS